MDLRSIPAATLLAGVLFNFCAGLSLAQEETSKPSGEVLTSTDWKVLHLAARPVARPLPLPEDSPLQVLDTLQFIGPAPGHPFDLGEYSADADWQLLNGYLVPTGGKNAALQLGFADQFEMEGILDVGGVGGWFLLLGWDQGRGFALSNVTMRTAESGSPWFLTAFRGNAAIEGTHEEFPKFEWKGEQPCKVVVKDQTLTMIIGRKVLFDALPLEGYAPGAVILGTYDTRYGPKKLRIKSLRIRALAADKTPAAKPKTP
jgi:hypothetical protein